MSHISLYMHCPSCHTDDTRVIETRTSGDAIRRRRACTGCGRRFTTFERLERGPLVVRKRDGSREPFERAKLVAGVMRAAHKRPVEVADAEAIVDSIEAEIEAAGGELPTSEVGELTLRGLSLLDPVAYVRFASVYRDFADLEQFEAELARLDTGAIASGPARVPDTPASVRIAAKAPTAHAPAQKES